MVTKKTSLWKDVQKAFNTGVSYMLPSVVVGGVFLAIALSTGKPTDNGMEITNQFMKNLNDIGVAGFAMMIPLLSGYIAYSIASKPALAPGMILGYIANNPIGEGQVKTGFLGAMLLGVLTGYFVKSNQKMEGFSNCSHIDADFDCSYTNNSCIRFVVYLCYCCTYWRSHGLVGSNIGRTSRWQCNHSWTNHRCNDSC